MLGCLITLGCQKEEVSSDITDINVPDGFNFNSVQKVSLDLTTVDASNNKIENVSITIKGVNESNIAEQIFSGQSDSEARLSIELEFPNHFKKIEIITTYQGLEKNYLFEMDTNIKTELQVN